MYEALSVRPEFAAEQRQWEAHERLQMLGTLHTFMVPMARHIELGRSLDSMLRSGYVGRAPRTPEHAKRFRADYPLVGTDTPYLGGVSALGAQVSALLMGNSGMGKTTAVKRFFSNFPQVIYHPEFNLYQVTRLHVEMPSDGSSIKGLAHGILHQLDQLIPGARYFETYAQKGRTGADSLMRSVARVMNMHCVGFLVADEIQNLTNSRKSAQTVMTELVSACNDLGVPLLYIGTNKAAQIFSLDFRQSRRASGHGMTEWARLPEDTEDGTMSEWRGFLSVLWSFQWTRKPVQLDAQLASTMYHCCQGVIDLAIKLFASAQARAILDGTETVTARLVANVYEQEFKLLHPMVDAMRKNDVQELIHFSDIAPVSLQEMMHGFARKAKVKGSAAYTVKSDSANFEARVTTSLVAAGFDEEEARAAAEVTASGSDQISLADGVQAAISLMAPVKRTRAKSSLKKVAPVQAQDDYAERPEDYRRAGVLARQAGTSVLQKMQDLGMLEPLCDLVELG
ncbi:TniB family NTP-binding protein [Oxalobacteraceae bacterium OTU3CINTB1]|nr:TniB family NTP-binding protein [Oxalobacteraceae bacterium OTU3CINTB1]